MVPVSSYPQAMSTTSTARALPSAPAPEFGPPNKTGFRIMSSRDGSDEGRSSGDAGENICSIDVVSLRVTNVAGIEILYIANLENHLRQHGADDWTTRKFLDFHQTELVVPAFNLSLVFLDVEGDGVSGGDALPQNIFRVGKCFRQELCRGFLEMEKMRMRSDVDGALVTVNERGEWTTEIRCGVVVKAAEKAWRIVHDPEKKELSYAVTK